MNLIQQAEALKNLSDEQLSTELRMPTGAAAPFMVASEIGRRKDMRARYAAEEARRAPQTTVMDDLLSGASSPAGGGGGLPGSLPGAGGGLPPPAAPGGSGGLPAPAQGFADGGLVDAVDYNEIAQHYQDVLDQASEDKQRAAALALLAAGAGIMSGGHSNTLSNIGAGIQAGTSSYADALKAMDTEQTNALRGLTDIGQLQHAEELARLQEERAARQQAMDEAAAAAGPKPTADMQNFAFRSSLPPDQQAEWDREHVNPNALGTDALLGAKMDAIYQDAQKKYPIPDPNSIAGISDNAAQIAADQLRKAQADAYNRIKAAYGEVAANQWAAGMGIAVGDLVLGTNAILPPAASSTDPFQLGL